MGCPPRRGRVALTPVQAVPGLRVARPLCGVHAVCRGHAGERGRLRAGQSCTDCPRGQMGGHSRNGGLRALGDTPDTEDSELGGHSRHRGLRARGTLPTQRTAELWGTLLTRRLRARGPSDRRGAPGAGLCQGLRTTRQGERRTLVTRRMAGILTAAAQRTPQGSRHRGPHTGTGSQGWAHGGQPPEEAAPCF